MRRRFPSGPSTRLRRRLRAAGGRRATNRSVRRAASGRAVPRECRSRRQQRGPGAPSERSRFETQCGDRRSATAPVAGLRSSTGGRYSTPISRNPPPLLACRAGPRGAPGRAPGSGSTPHWGCGFPSRPHRFHRSARRSGPHIRPRPCRCAGRDSEVSPGGAGDRRPWMVCPNSCSVGVTTV